MKDNLVLSNLFHRPARTLVSIFGIGTGVLLILFTIGLANGTLRETARREANVGAEILVRASGSFGLSGTDPFRLSTSDADEIEKLAGVALAVPMGQNLAAAKDNTFGNRLIEAVDFDRYARLSGIKIVQGRAFTEYADEIIADSSWLTQKKLQVGAKTPLYEREFTIVGAFEPAIGGRLKIPLTTMQEQLGGAGKCTGILVKVADNVSPEAVAESIAQKFPDFQIVPTKEIEEIYMNSIPALNVFLDVVIGVAAAISALIILLTMYTTVTERTRQIGIMKSLGMSKTGIAWIVTQEALLISFLGVCLGVLLTTGLRFILAQTTTMHVNIDWQLIIITLAVGLVGGALGALYPALRAARLDAVEALNYE